jgi:hypothetical protein
MQAFGDARLRDVTTSQVAAFLRGLDRSGIEDREVQVRLGLGSLSVP